MAWLDRFRRQGVDRAELRAAPAVEQRAVAAQSASEFFAALGISQADLPPPTLDKALQVPAVACAVNFLPATMAHLPLQLFKSGPAGSEKQDGALAIVLGEAPNQECSSFDFRRLLWFQYFTGGRGLAWIERNGNGQPVALWNMDPAKATIRRERGRKWYYFDNQREPYAAGDVIDLVWMPKADGLGHYGPISRGARAINDLLAMQQFSSQLFSKGGVPPLALSGTMPTTGADAMRRALNDVKRGIEVASEMGIPVAQIPPGFKLEKIGVDPQSGQMIEAKRYGVEEIARLFGLPPVFLQDLSHGTFSNTEQQDLHLVKHRVVQLAVQFEQELNLKLFGPVRNQRYVKHNVDGLLRGDFKSRMEGLARGVQGSIYTPNDARKYLDLPRSDQDGADKLHMQGATVPIDAPASSNGATNGN